MASVQKPGRLSGIELLRFAAAFTVLIAHYFHFYMHGYEYRDYAFEHQPLFQLLEPFYRYGTRAVEVFWCLSGFIFYHQYATVIHLRGMPIMRFFWLRFSRLYPLHLLTLVTVAALQWAYHAKFGVFYIVETNNIKHFLLNLLFVQYWGFQDAFSFNTPAWSVSVELLVYLFFYLSTRVLGTSIFNSLFCLGLCSGLNSYLGAEPVIGRCFFYFYAGGLAWLTYRLIRDKSGRWQVAAVFFGLALVVLLHHHFTATHDVDFLLNFEVPIILVVLALISPLLQNRAGQMINSLGNLTYASYLIHFPLQLVWMLMIDMIGIRFPFANSPFFLVGYVATVLTVSYFVYKWIEMPAQQLIRRRFVDSYTASNKNSG